MSEGKVITLPYKPRPLWKKILHPAMEKYNKLILVCHRRFGKTIGSVNELIRQAVKCEKKSPQLAYIAPYRNQAKLIAWKELCYYTSFIPGVKVNQAELYVEFPSLHKNAVGARIYVIGADNPHALRGTYWDMVVLDEYAQIKPELLGEVITPALMDRNGKLVLIGTPRGQNAFYNMYLEAIKNPTEWFSYLCTVTDSGVFTEEQIEQARNSMTDVLFAQEFMCDFTVSAQNIVIPIRLVDEAIRRNIAPNQVAGQAVIIGVDVARFGDDSTTIWRRQGTWVDRPRVYKGLNVMEVADRVMMAIRDWEADICFIDSGAMGSGVVDRLHQLGFTNVVEINFGQNAIDMTRYANIRAEMYFKLQGFLEAGGCLPNIAELKEELTVTEYDFNKIGKIQLNPKEEIKEKLGRSPDLADGLVLTFAKPFVKPSRLANDFINRNYAMDDYNPLADI